MCFIKNIYKSVASRHSLIPSHQFNKFSKTNDIQNETGNKEKILQKQLYTKNIPQNKLQLLLLNFLSNSLIKNSNTINTLNQKIQECQQKIGNLFADIKDPEPECHNIDDSKQLKQCITELCFPDDAISIKEQYSNNALTNKLFGQKKYKYRLDLGQAFPDVIYKERNIKVNAALKNMNGNIIKNSNIINLCFALADDNGNWINQNRVGDPMLKGKTQVELYHGEAQFNKIYTKDISRTFPNGRVNIVIYAKPSALVYDGLTSEYQQHIDENCIEPLIINDIVIKAKKKY